MSTNLIVAIVLVAMTLPPMLLIWYATIEAEKSDEPFPMILGVAQKVMLALTVWIMLICWQLSVEPVTPPIKESPLMTKARIKHDLFIKRYR